MGNTSSRFPSSCTLPSKQFSKVQRMRPHQGNQLPHSLKILHVCHLCVWRGRGSVEILLSKDCMDVFCNNIKKEAKRLYHMFPPKPMEPQMPEQWREFNRATKCHICFEHFKLWDTIVRDHCHYTGK